MTQPQGTRQIKQAWKSLAMEGVVFLRQGAAAQP